MKQLKTSLYFVLLTFWASSAAARSSGPTENWAMDAGTSLTQPFGQNAKSYSVNTLSGAYNFSPDLEFQHHFEADLRHTYVWGAYADQRPSQIAAFDLDYEFSRKFLQADSAVTYGLDLGAPVSDSDRDAGFVGSLEAYVGLHHRYGRHSFGLRGGVTGYNFRYDTTTEGGSVYNKQVAFMTRGTYGYAFTRRLNWRSHADLISYVNYAGSTLQEYYLATGPGYAWTKNLTSSLRLAATDALETYKTPTNQEITSLSLGLEWSI